MNPVIKKKWIDALRSGEYEQGDGYLRVGDRFCCLGVLCDLYMNEHPEEAEFATEQCHYYSYFGKGELLPDQVVAWAEFEENEIESHDSDTGSGIMVQCNRGPNGPYSISGLNDSGYTFEQLSKLIEGSL